MDDENSRVVTWGIPALLLVAGLVSVETSGGLPRLRLLKRLGDASYSIYLLPSMLIGAFMYVTRTLPQSISIALCLLTVGWLGILSHRLLEQPINQMLRGLTRPARVRAQALAHARMSNSAEP